MTLNKVPSQRLIMPNIQKLSNTVNDGPQEADEQDIYYLRRLDNNAQTDVMKFPPKLKTKAAKGTIFSSKYRHIYRTQRL